MSGFSLQAEVAKFFLTKLDPVAEYDRNGGESVKTGRQATDPDGVPLWKIGVLVKSPGQRPFEAGIKVPAKVAPLADLDPDEMELCYPVGLVITFYGDRNGSWTLRADSISSEAPPALGASWSAASA